MNQADIVAAMQVLPDIDVEYEIRRRVDFIKYQLELSGQKTLVLGISGGIDSCACGRLAQLAVEELNQVVSGYRFIAVACLTPPRPMKPMRNRRWILFSPAIA